MDVIVAALRDQQAELSGHVSGRDDASLDQASRCPGWTVADVLLHLAQTNDMAVASIEGRVEEFMLEAASGMAPGGSVDDWAGTLVDLERGSPTAALDRWTASATAQADAFAACDPDQRLTWVSGQLAARSLATTRLAETWIHTGDVASAYGPQPAPTDRLWHIARLAWRTVPYALARAGVAASAPVVFELTAPDGSTWTFGDAPDPTDPNRPVAVTTLIRGSALALCTVAGQRADAADTDLTGTGPDAEAVLRLVRTFA